MSGLVRSSVAISIVTAAGAVLGACSALIDTDPYLGTADAGDGAVDSSVPANAPTTPEIRIDPSAPRTDADLEVVVTVESTDPESGTISYEYRWMREGEIVSALTSATVPASNTAEGETWRVEVTPIAEPGARRGPAGFADVTIGNTPPVPRRSRSTTTRPRWARRFARRRVRSSTPTA